MSYYHSPRARQLFASLAAVVCPSDPDPRRLVGEIASHTELSMRAFPQPARLALLVGLKTYDEAARVFPASRGRAARDLDGEAASRYFASWLRGKFAVQREFARGVKGLVCLAYYETAEAKAKIGYTPEAWIEKVKKHRLAVYSDAIERQQEAILAADPLPPLDAEVV